MKESGMGVPFHKHGTPANQGSINVPTPLHEKAFDHPETRAAWVAYLAYFPNASNEYEKQRAAGAIVLATFCYLALVYLHRDRMACLKRIRRVLENHPWQFIPAVRRSSGIKDAMGVPVQLRYLEGEEPTGLMSARNPLHRRCWPEGLDHGAWYTGDVWQAGGASTSGFGVLAVPGGGELMGVSRRAGVR
ncbi:hypothetical protein OG585_32205 [Streptomyces sp. NBC_01340]|uniref:hypothetical protein n=1 Tax=Streptomyces sp. NBC_01340 TaxID=2903830 RepID=UPI002E0F67F5|nr:hypothetical protein OG585_32205 [Streptomyces sp. NBC_01340]